MNQNSLISNQEFDINRVLLSPTKIRDILNEYTSTRICPQLKCIDSNRTINAYYLISIVIHYRINISKLSDTVPFEDIDINELKTELDFNVLINDLKLVMQDG